MFNCFSYKANGQGSITDKTLIQTEHKLLENRAPAVPAASTLPGTLIFNKQSQGAATQPAQTRFHNTLQHFYYL